jgi:hypothetical protein
MKYLPIIVSALTFAFFSFTPTTPRSSEQNVEESKVRSAVENWASSTFYKNDGKKFERFYADYSDEFYIYKLKIEMYEKKLRTISTQQKNGSYPKSNEEFNKESTDLTNKIASFNEMAASVKPKVSQYTIKYWTNVQMSNGILMYYSFNVVLDDDYKVISHKIVDKIGDKGDNATIVYK